MMIRDLARACGADGMVGGQMLDLAAEGRFGQATEIKDTFALAAMQAMKTGALIEVACTLGAHLALAPEEERQRMARFGQSLGLAFQISDDLLDITATAEEAGKATGKDEKPPARRPGRACWGWRRRGQRWRRRSTMRSPPLPLTDRARPI
jgi:farnesyl diphosphate synthase